jgi:beta-galactosidase/beta-glucuronidase
MQTRWAQFVSLHNARRDYPRPHAIRKEWKSLNGLWEFAFDDANRGRTEGWMAGQSLPERILVPWTFEAALSGIGKGDEIHEYVWYRRTWDIPPTWRRKRVRLHLGAVDWESSVWVNGVEVGTHRGGYTPFSFDITDALKPDNPQEVVVAVYDPADPQQGAYQPKGKQLGSQGIWYTRTTGIWQSVWLEPVHPTHIATFSLEPNTELTGWLLHLVVANPECTTLLVNISRNRKAVCTVEEKTSETVTLPLPVAHPELWSPENPALYDISLILKQNGHVVDEIQTYGALRSVGIHNGRIMLNDKPYFLKAVLDQGFWPEGIYTAPTEEALRYDVEMTRAFGFNTARKHVKVEDPRWYYWCDRLGLLVAQDMPSSHNLSTPEAKKNFSHEWQQVVAALRMHPCVILWIPFNENWGEPGAFQDEIVDLTRAEDPSRPIIDASGWIQRDKTDIIDIHDYGNDLKKHAIPDPTRPKWIGEYGGIALPVEGHTWADGWGYQTVNSPEELLEKYQFLTSQINGAPGLSGYCYTQLTDVEQELNGLMTYDRIPKAAPEQFAEINRGEIALSRRSVHKETGEQTSQ